MSGSYWGARDVGFVASNGIATQLFPYPTPAAASMAVTTTYPPTPGNVRRPTHGRIISVKVTSDGSNAGYVELWDVAGLDRGASNNVNSGGDTVTDAYLIANGRMIEKAQIQATAGADFTTEFTDIPFNNGLAIRFVASAGVVSVAPMIEGGFMLRPVVC